MVRTQTVRFSPTRSAMPRTVRIGYESDNLVERLEFVLPDVAAEQSAALLIGGRMSNMVLLDRGTNGRWGVDLTREIVGDADAVEAYVRVDTADGRTWNSGAVTLVTNEVIGVETDIEMQYPSAFDQFFSKIFEHDSEMRAQSALVNESVSAAENASDTANEHAQRAALYAEAAQNAFDKICPPFEESGATVHCHPVAGSRLSVVSGISAVQTGSGNPSPDNVRPISGHEGVVLRVNDATYGAQFGQTVYGGAYDWTRGVLTVTHGVLVLTGEESFSVSGKVYYHAHSGGSGALENGACSHFRCETGAAYNTLYPDSVEVRAARLWVYAARFETAAELKAYLAAQYAAGTPVTVVYPLAEEYEVQLTGTIITAAEGENVLMSSTGNTSVSGRSDPVWVIGNLTARVAALEAAVVNGN
jgi:hypothetical protein